MLDGMEEAVFAPGRVVLGISWFNYPDIPPALVARVRPPPGGAANP
ncbi:MAG: hypothetical protein IT337_00095 [Thermomicrobiales bacterium]|nr:hypothetical protein [Thermomicrobiales bacterium]